MDEQRLKKILSEMRQGSREINDVVEILKNWPAEELDFACLDHQRKLRTGFPEVVYGAGKSPEQIIAILQSMLKKENIVLATRVDHQKAEIISARLPQLQYHAEAQILVGNEAFISRDNRRGRVLVICAGTSDIPVAEEAVITARCLGNETDHIYDVGVAGMHRLLAHRHTLNNAAVLIVVAGMEGALPSVIGGMIDKPIIAVPTSVGYGTSLGGLTALFSMLNSCSPGMAVVNIDNGFGAACMATAINSN